MRLHTLVKLFDVGFSPYGVGLLALLAALTAAYIALVGVEQAMPGPTPDFQHPPVYPNAENVKWGDDVMLGGLLGEEMQEKVVGKVLTFDTADPPEAVLSYYREAMPKEGWSTYDQPRTETTSLFFSYSERQWSRKGLIIHMVMVEVTLASEQRTSIKLTMRP